MYCRSLLSLTVSLESLALQSPPQNDQCQTRDRRCVCRSRSARTARAPRRRAGPGGTIPRARVTVRPRGVSVSAHILSTTQPLILSKDTDSIRAHILAGANRKRWPAHMDMHEDTAPPHAAVSTCPICNAEQTDRRFGLTCSSLFAYSHLGALRRHERWSRAILKHLSGVSLRRVQDDSLLR